MKDLLGLFEEAQVGVVVNELGTKCGVLVEAMQNVSSMDLKEVIWVVAEV